MSIYNKNTGFGAAILNHIHSIIPTFGNVFVVYDADDTSSPSYQIMQEVVANDPKGIIRFYTSLASAYAATTSNNNDVILLDGRSTHELDTMLTVSKNRVHFIGFDGGNRLTAQGAKIQLSTTGNAVAVAATISNTGTRNSYRNLKIMNSGTDAASIAGMIDSGEGTLIENCSIMKFTDLNVATVADFICRADSATYKNCEFGFDTLVQSAARPTFWINKSGSTRAKHLRVENCYFSCSSSEATKVFIKVEDTSSLAFENTFNDCTFSAAVISSASAAALTNAVASASGLVEGTLNFGYPRAFNVTNFCAGVTDQVQVVAPAVSANAIAGVTPS